VEKGETEGDKPCKVSIMEKKACRSWLLVAQERLKHEEGAPKLCDQEMWIPDDPRQK